MKLDPKKTDLSKLVSLLKKLAAFPSKDERNWAAETLRTLDAGRLEDFDIDEFVAHEYEAELAPAEDKRPVWDRAQALLALIDEMRAKGLRAARAAKVGEALKGWKQTP